jgi:hypothetical protein
MQHRSRNLVTALLAASVLALAGFTGTALAHGPGHPGPGFPGTSAKPLPSGWAWPSDDIHTAKPPVAVPSKKPDPSKKPEPAGSPKQPGTLCVPVVTPTGTAAPTGVAAGADDKIVGFMHAAMPDTQFAWMKLSPGLQKRFDADLKKVACTVDLLRAALDKQITSRVAHLQVLDTQVGKSGLGASDQAVVTGEINSLIADLKALKVKVDAETTLADLQADLVTLGGKTATYNTVGTWVRLIVGAENVIATGPKLVTLENKVAADIAAAPDSPEKIDAQTFLADMKTSADAAQALAAPLPATLLAITPAQLANGSAKTTLDSVRKTLATAQWDVSLARWAAFWAERELKEGAPKATSTPVVTPAPTMTPAPTATPTV